jgi:hypothetical protein
MFVGQCFAGFQFDDETALNKKIGVILTKSRTVLIGYLQGMLLLETDSGLLETMGQSVLMHLLQVPMPQVPVQGQADLPNPITQGQDIPLVHSCALYLQPSRRVSCPMLLTPIAVSFRIYSPTLCVLCLLWPPLPF